MRRVICALLMVCALTGRASAQSYMTLQLIRPAAVGAAGTGWDADNPIYRAYSGMTYTFRAEASGGKWPYSYVLTNAPAGMSVVAGPCTAIALSCDAGKITWTNPTTDASNITLTVTDSLGSNDAETWSIDVNTNACGAADGWCFISGSGDDGTGDGSFASPWRSLQQVWATVSADSNILVLRTGTYTVLDTTNQTTPGDCGEQIAWSETTRPVSWMGYPGETATIDFNYDAGGREGACMEFAGQNIWLQNITAIDMRSIGWQFNARSSNFGVYAADNVFNRMLGACGGCNSAPMMWSSTVGGQGSFGDFVSHCQFTDAGANPVAGLKLYSVERGVIEHNTFANFDHDEAAIALKYEMYDTTVRANQCGADVLTCIGGNMNFDTATHETSGEAYHNLTLGSGTGSSEGALTLGVSKVDSPADWQVYRNTFIGLLNIQNVVTADGPYSFFDNVIENSGGSGSPAVCTSLGATCTSITDSTRIIDNGDNLVGVDVVDASGNLSGGNTVYLGSRGYQLAAGSSGTIRLRIRGEM